MLDELPVNGYNIRIKDKIFSREGCYVFKKRCGTIERKEKRV